MPFIKNGTRRLCLLGLFSAFAVLLSFIENMLPPLPFLPPGTRAGLSNIITMYAAGAAGLPSALGIAVVKSLFVLTTRGVSAFLISLCGGILSTLAMAAALHRHSPFGCIGIGVIGAAAHQIAQFALSLLLIGRAIMLYLPITLAVSVVTGCITGAALYMILPVFNRLSRQFWPVFPAD